MREKRSENDPCTLNGLNIVIVLLPHTPHVGSQFHFNINKQFVCENRQKKGELRNFCHLRDMYEYNKKKTLFIWILEADWNWGWFETFIVVNVGAFLRAFCIVWGSTWPLINFTVPWKSWRVKEENVKKIRYQTEFLHTKLNSPCRTLVIWCRNFPARLVIRCCEINCQIWNR